MKHRRFEKDALLEAFTRPLAHAPEPEFFLARCGGACQWRVNMLMGGIYPLGRMVNHRKLFMRTRSVGRTVSRVIGCNIFFKSYSWGNFVVQPEFQTTSVDDRTVTLLDYSEPLFNNCIVSRIRDEIRTTGDDRTLLGRFNLEISARKRFVGFFSLWRGDYVPEEQFGVPVTKGA
jgi:hypothetical protein